MNRVTATAAALALSVVAIPARAAELADGVWVTESWAGYVVRSSASFTGVTGTWTQPRVLCNRPGSSVSIWIGIGGADNASTSLEQIGTAADCDGRGRLSISAWYELFPLPPVDVPVTVREGDLVSASVRVTGTSVSLVLTNLTTGASFSSRQFMTSPETDSAEWIVEAPAACFLTCTTMALADFRRVQFVDAWTRGESHAGAVGDSAWNRWRLAIGSGKWMRARPSRLADGGTSFAVTRARPS